MDANNKITIILADDHILIRESWEFVLNADPRFSVVATTANGEEVVELVQRLRPQIVLMDVNLVGMNGIEATKLISRLVPETKVIGLSMHTNPVVARKIIQNGGQGYVTKNSDGKELFHAILQVVSGKKYICNEVKNILADLEITKDKVPGTDALTKREIEIIKMIIQGTTSKEIAEKIGVAVKTVDTHRYNILKKLNLKNTASLVNWSHSAGLNFDLPDGSQP